MWVIPCEKVVAPVYYRRKWSIEHSGERNLHRSNHVRHDIKGHKQKPVSQSLCVRLSLCGSALPSLTRGGILQLDSFVLITPLVQIEVLCWATSTDTFTALITKSSWIWFPVKKITSCGSSFKSYDVCILFLFFSFVSIGWNVITCYSLYCHVNSHIQRNSRECPQPLTWTFESILTSFQQLYSWIPIIILNRDRIMCFPTFTQYNTHLYSLVWMDVFYTLEWNRLNKELRYNKTI